MTGGRSTVNVLDILIRLWWSRIPAAIGRFSRTAGLVATDGIYLIVVPPLAAVAPLGGFLLGGFVGLVHPLDGLELFSGWIVTLAAIVAIGQFSANVGGWVVAGYALTDFFLFGHSDVAYACFDCSLPESLVRLKAPLLISYVLLAWLVVLFPLAARAVGTATMRPLQRFGPPARLATIALVVFLEGSIVLIWTNLFAPLARPVYTWVGASPDSRVFQAVQVDGWILVAIAGIAAGARGLLEPWAAGRPTMTVRIGMLLEPVARIPRGRRLRIPLWLSVMLSTAFLTLMLSGILDSVIEIVPVAGAVLLATLLRIWIGHRSAWVSIVGRIPLLIRFVATFGAAYFVGSWLASASNESQAFWPILASVLVSLVLVAVLFPARPPDAADDHTTAAAQPPAAGLAS